MKWMPIMMQPVLIGAMYLLVKIYGWNVWEAAGLIVLVSGGIPLLIAIGITPFLSAEGRKEFLGIVFSTFVQDLKHIFDLLTLKK